MKPIIEIQNVSKVYKIGRRDPYITIREAIEEKLKSVFQQKARVTKSEFWALKNISFDINQGEILGIIGPNGAGKSTLLKILSQITLPTKGNVLIRGHVGSLLEVGTGFHPELTGRENIYLNGAILGMKRKEISRKLDEIIEFAEIEKFIDTPVKRYSSGMYVRLAFSVAAQLEPEILLVDEVLSVGDLVFQKKSLGKISDISRSGRTVIFVSHSMGAIKSICSRVVLIDKGKIMADGNPDAVISKYANIGTRHTEGPTVKYDLKPETEGQHHKLTLLNSKMIPTNVLKLGEKAYAIVEFEIRKQLRNVDVDVMISEGGAPLWLGLDTDAKPQLLSKRIPGRYKHLVELPTHVLMPGSYHLGSSMGYVGVGPIDTQYYNGIDFEVLNVSVNSKHRVQRREKGGMLVYIKDWRNY